MYATHHVIGNIYVYTYMHVATIKMEAMNLKESKGCMEGFGGQKWRGEIMKLYCNLKKKWGKGERRNEAKGFEVEIHKHN